MNCHELMNHVIHDSYNNHGRVLTEPILNDKNPKQMGKSRKDSEINDSIPMTLETARAITSGT